MEKRLFISTEIILCNCSNHLLLAPDTICEVCMGLVSGASELEDLVSNAPSEQFDLSYFEALACMFESFEFAA